ncbi:MAG: hypothetical protein DHS20C05_11710 [Hyphococcus sp.]|nr:MAG: hypothetical protein DHS20C05_11710 [Marinicaulis sp.]
MLRSLFAIIVASILGLTVAKVIEGGGQALFFSDGEGLSPNGSLSLNYHVLLLVGWLFGAFAASSIALLLGSRWAPLGMLASVTIMLASFLTITSFSLDLLLFPAACLFIAAGSYAAHRLINPVSALPVSRKQQEPFYDE